MEFLKKPLKIYEKDMGVIKKDRIFIKKLKKI